MRGALRCVVLSLVIGALGSATVEAQFSDTQQPLTAVTPSCAQGENFILWQLICNQHLICTCWCSNSWMACLQVSAFSVEEQRSIASVAMCMLLIKHSKISCSICDASWQVSKGMQAEQHLCNLWSLITLATLLCKHLSRSGWKCDIIWIHLWCASSLSCRLCPTRLFTAC